jgi:hypothetical protein
MLRPEIGALITCDVSNPTCRTRNAAVELDVTGWHRKSELDLKDWICKTQHAVFEMRNSIYKTWTAELNRRNSTLAYRTWDAELHMLNAECRTRNAEFDVREWTCGTRNAGLDEWNPTCSTRNAMLHVRNSACSANKVSQDKTGPTIGDDSAFTDESVASTGDGRASPVNVGILTNKSAASNTNGIVSTGRDGTPTGDTGPSAAGAARNAALDTRNST